MLPAPAWQQLAGSAGAVSGLVAQRFWHMLAEANDLGTWHGRQHHCVLASGLLVLKMQVCPSASLAFPLTPPCSSPPAQRQGTQGKPVPSIRVGPYAWAAGVGQSDSQLHVCDSMLAWRRPSTCMGDSWLQVGLNGGWVCALQA